MKSPRIQLAPSTPDSPEFSRIVLGLWRLCNWELTPQQRLTLIEQSLELGITTIDHADIYGSYGGEAQFGEALALAPHLRDKMELVSKCGIKLISPQRPTHRLQHYDTSRAHIIASAENSLACLRTDYLDLLLIHRPDPLLEADEVAEAFQHLKDSGKVRHFGVSNFTPFQYDLLASRFPLVTNQVELSVMHLDPLHDGTLDQCQQRRIVPMIWSALAGGQLFSDPSERAEQLRTTLTFIGNAHDVSATTIAYAWILRHPSKPIVLTGSRRIAAIKEAVAATEIVLTREQWFAIWCASTGGGVA